MKVEIMTNSEFGDVVERFKFNAKRRYRNSIDLYNEYPYYEIWEIDKSDVRAIEEACIAEDVLFCYSKGANRGTPFEPLTIGGQFAIGWTAVNNKSTFNGLIDYLINGLEIADVYEMNACATAMAKANGLSLSQLWNKLEG